jgi:hypothetical protein
MADGLLVFFAACEGCDYRGVKHLARKEAAADAKVHYECYRHNAYIGQERLPAELTDERLAELEAAGICPVCEVDPVADDDCMCGPCRQRTEDMSSLVVDPVELVLSSHWTFDALCSEDHQFCRCGWEIDSGPGYHRRHLAEMIYKALGLDGPAPWVDGPLVEHPVPQVRPGFGEGGRD